MQIDLAKQFSPYPSGRFPTDGSFNGQKFREELLAPALHDAKRASPSAAVVVDIDGVRSFGSSFLEEAFAGLVRSGEFSGDELSRLLVIRCSKPHLLFFKDSIDSLIKNAEPEPREGKPQLHA